MPETKRPQCTAKSKQSGEQCKKTAEPGSTKCRMHGGATPRGPALPQYIDGRASKYALPARLADRYKEAMADPDLLSLRPAVAVYDARLGELFARLDTGESGGAWKALAERMVDVNMAIKAGDFDALNTGLREVTRIIKEGAAEEAAWSEIRQTFEARRRVGETEQKRLAVLNQFISAEQMMGMLAECQRIIARYVDEPEKRRSLARDFEQLVLVDAG
jgi:hypothetical protein